MQMLARSLAGERGPGKLRRAAPLQCSTDSQPVCCHHCYTSFSSVQQSAEVQKAGHQHLSHPTAHAMCREVHSGVSVAQQFQPQPVAAADSEEAMLPPSKCRCAPICPRVSSGWCTLASFPKAVISNYSNVFGPGAELRSHHACIYRSAFVHAYAPYHIPH